MDQGEKAVTFHAGAVVLEEPREQERLCLVRDRCGLMNSEFLAVWSSEWQLMELETGVAIRLALPGCPSHLTERILLFSISHMALNVCSGRTAFPKERDLQRYSS